MEDLHLLCNNCRSNWSCLTPQTHMFKFVVHNHIARAMKWCSGFLCFSSLCYSQLLTLWIYFSMAAPFSLKLVWLWAAILACKLQVIVASHLQFLEAKTYARFLCYPSSLPSHCWSAISYVFSHTCNYITANRVLPWFPSPSFLWPCPVFSLDGGWEYHPND